MLTAELKQNLYERYQSFKAENPKLRVRDTAAQLNVSEAQLLASTIGHEDTIELRPAFKDIVAKFEALGTVMALSRNEAAVSEITGTYSNIDLSGHAGLVLNTPGIDLRIFFREWKSGYATTVKTRLGDRKCFQFFDRYGDAIHKVYLNDKSSANAFDAIVQEFQAEFQSDVLEVEPQPNTEITSEVTDDIDTDGFLNAWRKMQDTHEFFGMLRKYNINRTQALRIAEGEFTRQVDNSTLERVLETASAEKFPIMVFIGNKGMIQIWGGDVKNIKKMGDWVNVLDPEFNLHLREDLISESWIIEKPTADGIVTSLELYDDQGENIGLFFGLRKPGQQELPQWRKLTESIPTL